MQHTGKSTHTSLGAAFFVFLGLAVIPFSLRAVGLEESLSPRLAAATDAWRQVADAFGGGYQPAKSELGAVKYPDAQFSNDAAETVCSARLSCEHRLPAEVAPSASGASLKPAEIARRASKPASQNVFRASEHHLAPHSEIIKAALLAPTKHLEALNPVKVGAAVDAEWLTALKKQMRRWGLQSAEELHRLQMPKRLQVVVQMKSPVLSRKAAECKVQAALASTNLLDIQRARLITVPIAGPDNCEL